MAADDLVYALKDGEAVPAERNVRKVYAMQSVLIGSSGAMRYVEGGRLVPVTGGSAQDISVEYKFEDWIVDFIRERREAPNNSPKVIADALYERMRDTFKPVEIMLEYGKRDDFELGDRLLSYIVAGYANNFQNLRLFELGIEYADGRQLRYLAPFEHETAPAWANRQPKDLYLGEDEFFIRALDGREPESGIRKREWSKCVESISSKLPKLPEALQDTAASAVSLVKVEAEFNSNKVGSTVNVAVLDRVAKRSYLATF